MLKEVNKKVEKRTKRAVFRASLSNLGWTESHTLAFQACKLAIVYCFTLSHQDKDKRLCVYTDASDCYWSGILTQVPVADLREEHKDQAREPLAFHSGRF